MSDRLPTLPTHETPAHPGRPVGLLGDGLDLRLPWLGASDTERLDGCPDADRPAWTDDEEERAHE